MRLRKIKNAKEKLKANSDYFIDLEEKHFSWKEIFQNDHPIQIEIGCGKGQFISKLAVLHPDINYIAIEKYDSVLLRCLEKVEGKSIPNLKLVLMDATQIKQYFGKGEVELIYINFSDPWPKKAHQKRRLTSPDFLSSYNYILKDTGAIYQKTDNRHFFEYSLESFNHEDWLLSNISLDLHKDKDIFNITTEFEDKWSQLGPIYRLEARKRKS